MLGCGESGLYLVCFFFFVFLRPETSSKAEPAECHMISRLKNCHAMAAEAGFVVLPPQSASFGSSAKDARRGRPPAPSARADRLRPSFSSTARSGLEDKGKRRKPRLTLGSGQLLFLAIITRATSNEIVQAWPGN